MKHQIRIRQLFKLMQLMDRHPYQSEAQSLIWQECNNIIYLL